jgi:hypothetical protein
MNLVAVLFYGGRINQIIFSILAGFSHKTGNACKKVVFNRISA